ncbi:hydantoinase [Purpureocillium lavendulum]|uniref:Hydantoinase n=1 Tax=Purpureocillium lavendulum TaxID=1247861 RepID=A0AB34FPF0_9HYPO|nr:hydantoinase [Purpureocillium lavendulum]
MSLYRIGVDVGGTNTDAAILDIKALDSPGRGVLASHKATTTPDITTGIEEAIKAVLTSSAVDQSRVLSVTIGTTHFINALVEADARRLDRVAVVRLCGPFTRQIPPFAGFPVGLHQILDGGVYYLNGGLEMDGREIAALEPDEIRQAARDIVASGIKAVALAGVFSPLDHEGIHEERCKKILLEEAPDLNVVCSHDIGPTGFLERENATILNAAILRTGHRVKRGFRRAMARLNLSCPLYLSQNDGTLIDAEAAADFPIKTFASGPTNSMTGAAFLAGIDQKHDGRPNGTASTNGDSNTEQEQILVVDIGGTTTDVCALLPSGFPRQAPGFVEFGGVRTAFSMPEVVSVGLGGGSKVSVDKAQPESVSVGPGSVGHFIREQAKIFGGSTLTATDIVVAAGKAELGDSSLIKDIPQSTIDLARKDIKKKLEAVIDKMKVSAAPVTVLLVGGGALLVTEELAGVAKCISPVHQGAANAIGAAIGKVSGEVDTVEILEGKNEKDVLEAACKRAVDMAVEKGAARDDVKIVEVNRMPLQYMAQVTIRVQVRAVGKLAIPDDLTPLQSPEWTLNGDIDEAETQKVSVPNALEPTTKPSLGVDIESYRPDVRSGVWYISEIDLEFLATGTGVLGTGGGGPTYFEFLKGLESLRTGGKGKMRVVSPKSLKDDDIVCLGAYYGSPTVINERMSGGREIIDAIDSVVKVQGIKEFHALLVDEIGGGNGMCAFSTGVHYDLPVVDGDGMGRAYPTMYHGKFTFSVYGYPMTPCAITDAAGNSAVIMKTDTPVRLEKLMRNTAVELGLTCASSSHPLPGSTIKAAAVQNTISQAWYLGRAVAMARRKKANYVDAIFDVCAGKLLFTGKIVDVHRYIGGGYTMGAVILAPLGADEREAASASKQRVPTDKHMTIPFQNEYLYAAYSDAEGSKGSQEVVCTVPHLISILGQDGEAIGSQDLRYGLRVNVIALPAHPLWLTEKALKVGGPEGFNLDMPTVGVDNDFTEAKSVIDEFDS